MRFTMPVPQWSPSGRRPGLGRGTAGLYERGMSDTFVGSRTARVASVTCT
jgi:hypothetical protein